MFRKCFLIALCCALLSCSRAAHDDAPPVSTAPAAGTSAPDPKLVVEQFGRRLKNVSLLAEPQVAREAMRENYAELVTPKLLDSWMNDPANAPGRQVSSPWPDRIEVEHVNLSGENAVVRGVVVEATSTGEARRVPVQLRLERVGDAWRIAAYETDDAGSAVAVVRRYYDAINARDFAAAYALWGSGGPPDQSREEFAAGFAETESVQVTTREPSRIEGAAGSHYVEVPVTIVAKLKSGEVQRFEGIYTLRRSMVDGATPEQRRWHLYRASVRRTN